jgi:hypothetical protein
VTGPGSLGTPAPFTSEQVEALVRGKADESEIAHVLESHTQPRVSSRKRHLDKAAPVPISEKALRELTSGGTPPGVARRLDAAAKRDKQVSAEDDATADRPSERPPRPRRR